MTASDQEVRRVLRRGLPLLTYSPWALSTAWLPLLPQALDITGGHRWLRNHPSVPCRGSHRWPGGPWSQKSNPDAVLLRPKQKQEATGADVEGPVKTGLAFCPPSPP